MNILIFGKDGQLGKAFKAVFGESKLDELHRITYVGRAECDLSNADAITALLDELKPNLIMNAAAYTAVDKAETEVDLAYAINAKAPEAMAIYAKQHGATFLHYSTDYVFDGSKNTPYIESDARNPLGIYGKSKAAGEVAIENVFHGDQESLSESNNTKFAGLKAQYAIFRTSWVYGEGGNFIRTILRLAKEREELRIISDQHGVPTSAEWLAGLSLDLVLGEGVQLKRFPSGVYHAVPSGQTTWHGLATFVVQSAIEAGMFLKVKPDAIKPILAIEYPLPAQRPMNSSMATDKLQRTLAKSGPENAFVNAYSAYNELAAATKFPAWESMVREYVEELVAAGVI
jgi:dTDP-4-dehydrorhamnose reductase